MLERIGLVMMLGAAAAMDSESMALPMLIALAGAGLIYMGVLIESKKNHKRNRSHDASYPSFLRKD